VRPAIQPAVAQGAWTINASALCHPGFGLFLAEAQLDAGIALRASSRNASNSVHRIKLGSCANASAAFCRSTSAKGSFSDFRRAGFADRENELPDLAVEAGRCLVRAATGSECRGCCGLWCKPSWIAETSRVDGEARGVERCFP